MKKYFIISFLLFLILLSCSDNSFKQNLEVPSSNTTLKEKIDAIVVNKMNDYNIPGLSIGVVKNGAIIYAHGYGVKNIESMEDVTENSIFHTASISKLFTAIAIVQLENEGLLNLNDKLVDLIPELQFSDEGVKNISIENLLNHTSGLPDISNYHWSNNNQSDASLKGYILGLNLELNNEPNTTYYYSNLGYDILGHIIERVSGLSFDDYMKEQVLNKSGMHQSDFRYYNISDSLKTTPHTDSWITGNVKIRYIYPYTREHAPSSTLNASSKELSNWMISFLNSLNYPNSKNNYNVLLNPSTDLNSNIGFGFQLYDVYSKKGIGHYGGDKGFRSFLMMIPEENVGIVVLGNCDYKEDFRQEIVYPIAELLLEKE